MPRIASQTPAEAEAAIGTPRGQLTVTTGNRNAVRKWLVARGLPSDFACGLSKRELQVAYNNESDFQRIEKKYREGREAFPDDAAQTLEPAPNFDAPLISSSSAHSNGGGNDDDFWSILRKKVGSSVDAEQVRKIVSEMIEGVAIHHRTQVEVLHNGVPHATIEGAHK